MNRVRSDVIFHKFSGRHKENENRLKNLLENVVDWTKLENHFSRFFKT